MNARATIIIGTVAAFFIFFVGLLFGWVTWWFTPIIVIGGFIVLWALLPRYRQPEVRGENKYHLHP